MTRAAAAPDTAWPTDADMAAVLRGMDIPEPDAWAAALGPACRKHRIDTPARLSRFLGNVAHESDGFEATVENLNYSVDGLLRNFGRHRISAADARRLGRKPGERRVPEARQREIANLIYGGAFGREQLGNTQPNDGWFFRGAGLMQLTGRANFTRFAKAIGVSVADLPAMLQTKEGAAESAAAFFAKAGCNELADAGDDEGLRQRINGALKGFADVEKKTALALNAIGRGAGGTALA